MIKYIDQNKECRDLNVGMVADYFGVSISNLSHGFKMQTNYKISDHILNKKFEYAGDLLKKTDYKIQEVSYMLGYTQTSNFIENLGNIME